MARYTSLYQAPRSPLIQGRTRWERPLWQAWLGGVLVGGLVALLEVGALRVPVQIMRLHFTGEVWTLLAATIVMAGLGALLARFFGWRMRWVGASMLSCVGASAVVYFWYWYLGVVIG